LLIVPLSVVIGESPSSSASDIDNLNNHGLAKVAFVKDSNSPQVVGANHLMAARNHPYMMRLLAYVCFFCDAITRSWEFNDNRICENSFELIHCMNVWCHW
jgi:hypothetical protein